MNYGRKDTAEIIPRIWLGVEFYSAREVISEPAVRAEEHRRALAPFFEVGRGGFAVGGIVASRSIECLVFLEPGAKNLDYVEPTSCVGFGVPPRQ